MRRVSRALVRLVVAWALVVAGALVLAAGWFGVAGEAVVAKQLPYLVSGGLGGVALVITGAMLLMTHDVQSVGARLARLEQQIGELHAALLQGAEAPEPETPPVADAVVVLASSSRFHDAGCAVVVGKHGRRVALDEAVREGLVACRLCRPAPT